MHNVHIDYAYYAFTPGRPKPSRVTKSGGKGANLEASLDLGRFNFARQITAKAWDATVRTFCLSPGFRPRFLLGRL